jgi:hypothetical protein
VISGLRARLERATPTLLVGVLPTFLLVVGIVHFMLNHFFVRAPYLLDTGMLSWLSYHDGVLLAAPKIALDYVEYYYDVYFSPLTSLFSVLSYLVPVGRLEWYVILQAAVYAPIGPVVYLVSSRFEPGTALRRMPITIAAALAFSFSGLVLWMIGYPHFEAAMPGLISLMLASLVTGRTRWAWLWLVLAAWVRQDGGIHIATAIAPILFLSWRGRAMLPSRRTLIVMISAAVAMSVVGMLSIKLFFTPFPRLAQAYIGSPLYSHLNGPLLAERVRLFFEHSQVIYYPFVATCLLAALRRDAGYLLGWISTLPWFAFCFLAVEQGKATFSVYGAGPFMIGMLWCYLYGAHLAPVPRRMRAGALEAVFALVCVASTLGMYRAEPATMKHVTGDMRRGRPRDRAAVRTFVEVLHEHRARFGRLRVDGAVATLAMQYLDPSEVWRGVMSEVNTLAFHRGSPDAVEMFRELIANEFNFCKRIQRTGIVVCTRDPLPADTYGGLAIEVVPAALVEADLPLVKQKVIKFEDRGVVFQTSDVLTGRLGQLPRGTYEWTMTLVPDELMRLDGSELATLEVEQGGSRLAYATATRDERALTLRFDANGGEQLLTYHLGSRPETPLVFTSMRLRRVATP